MLRSEVRLGAAVLGLALFAAGCDGGATGGGGAAGLATTFDSTSGDTIVARVAGAVPPAAIRRLVEEMRIAPTEDDTSLFTAVTEFDVDARGRTWVFDRPSASIFIFGPDGRLERRFGRSGSGPGEFRQDNGMVFLPDGRLALWDSQNARVNFFSADGDFLQSWTHAAGFSTNEGLVADTAGNVYVRRPVAEPTAEDAFWRLGLVRLTEGGGWADSLVPPVLGVPTENYVAERNGGRSSTNVSFSPRAMWAWHRNGFFVSGDGAKYHLHFGRPNARPIRVERNMPPVPAAADERTNAEELVLASMLQNDPGWKWRGAPVPENKAPLMRLLTMRDGTVWAQVAVPSVLIPEDERMTSRDGRPVPRWTTPQVSEVFSAEGTFVMRIEMPPRTTPVEADVDTVWGLSRDGSGLPAIVRFRIATAGAP